MCLSPEAQQFEPGPGRSWWLYHHGAGKSTHLSLKAWESACQGPERSAHYGAQKLTRVGPEARELACQSVNSVRHVPGEPQNQEALMSEQRAV